MNDAACEPLISIALCTYNGAQYLREQLESLFAQTHRNIEIVAVDDCSTDDTLSLLEEYGRRDTRLRVISNSENIGIKKNFRRAMELCAGAFIAPCDQDDIWLPEKLSLLLAAIGNHPLAYCDSEFVDKQGRALNIAMSDSSTMISTDDPLVFAAINCVAAHSMLFNRALMKSMPDVPDCFYYDWWLAAVASSRGGVRYCNSKLVKYRLHDSNVTNRLRSRSGDRGLGYRRNRLVGFRLRLQYLAGLSDRNREFIDQLHELLVAQEHQWLSLRLGWFIFRHSPRVFALHKPRRARLHYALRFAVGMRLKRLSSPYGYAEVEHS